ncbi:MAG: glycogen synthase GlgA [Synechococcales cyanobacterium]
MADAKILFAAAEVAPFAKVGGMGDVAGSLPAVLRHYGLDVRVIMPFYGFLWDRFFGEEWEKEAIAYQPRHIWTGYAMFQHFEIFETRIKGTDVPLYLFSHFSFAPPQVYGGEDEQWRFTFFANGVAEFTWNYWKPNIIHCHDWHTGMIPAWMHQSADIGTVYTIHNLAYQGPWRWQLERFTWVPWYFAAHNTMAAGILYADHVTTVSPTYAREICTPEHGEKLEGLLSWKGDRVHGILNGIDVEALDPATDPALVKNFDRTTIERRIFNKDALQAELGLPHDRGTFLVGIVSRLVEQKGLDLVMPVIDRFLAYTHSQVVVLGSGEAYYESKLWELRDRFPDRFVFWKGFNAALAQRIYASCDAFLMPSRFEPCGISQMVALRYGCVPIVRRTGGLVDTVQHHIPSLHQGTGYCFDRYETLDAYTCMVRAWEAFQHKDTWHALQERGMDVDFSWHRSALDYIGIYSRILGYDPLLPPATAAE